MEFMECLNKDVKKKDTFCTSGIGILIATSSNLFNTKY